MNKIDMVDQQQQQSPFQVVLIDIQKAAMREIHCVEKPLEGSAEPLSFVALSYRWGEVQESIIDTQLGYLATITSFDLKDFYSLCKRMTLEPDLTSIQYVWVDAICVDQTNYERRKATIHHMSNIYEKATYILAVPDLHKQHLRNISTEYSKIMYYSHNHSDYIYHLIQGNTDQLKKMDDAFLDDIGAPIDLTLRQLLAKDTTYLADGFTEFQKGNYNSSDPEDTLDLLSEIYHASLSLSSLVPPASKDLAPLMKQQSPKEGRWFRGHLKSAGATTAPAAAAEGLLHYDKVAHLLLDNPHHRWKKIGQQGSSRMWTHELIRRRNAIRQVMHFLEDLILDWSTRVWVISEFHIAKQKNNLKYWFLQLSPTATPIKDVSFFTFDFTNPAFASVVQTTRFLWRAPDDDPNPAHLSFHRLLIKQLNTQLFFEMVLKSKASKNEDRFYAILPQSKYKDKVNQVDHWKINTLLSVKLKLFEIMDTKDKWTLLFLAGHHRASNTFEVLPTFCASNIDWKATTTFFEKYPCNFVTNNNKEPFSSTSAVISLRCTQKHALQQRLYYLRVKPKEYYVKKKPYYNRENSHATSKKTLYNQLQVDSLSFIEIVCLPQYDLASPQYDLTSTIPTATIRKYTYINGIALIGSFAENKWTLCYENWQYNLYNYERHFNDDKYGTVFNIY